MSHAAIGVGMAAAAGAAAGGIVTRGVKASVEGTGAAQDTIAMVAGLAADLFVSTVGLSLAGVKPSLRNVIAIGLGSYVMKRALGGVDGDAIPRGAIVEGAGGAMGWLILGAR